MRKRPTSPFVDLVVDHSKGVLALFVVIAGILSWQASRFEINASAETLLTKDNQIYQQAQSVNRRFSPQEFLLVVYRPRDHDVLSEQTFADLRTLSAELIKLPRVASVRSLLNVPLLSLAPGGLSGDLDPDQWTIEANDFSNKEIKSALTGHPIYQDLLVNQDFSATAIQVSFKRDSELEGIENAVLDLRRGAVEAKLSEAQSQKIERLQEQAEPLQKALDRTREHEIKAIRDLSVAYQDRAEILLGGAHVLGYEMIQIITKDLIVFGVAIFTIICLTLALIFRELKWVVIPVICCVFSVLPTMGLLALLGLKATVISANFIALQLILTIAIALHLIVQFIEEQDRHPNATTGELLKATLQEKTRPCLYAGITTSVGFASLLFSGLQSVISFGYMMIIAMGVSIVSSLIVFPAAVSLFARRGTPRSHKLTDSLLRSTSRLVLNRSGLIVMISLATIVISAAGLFLLNVENSFINYFRESTQTRRELAFIDQEFGGSTPLDVIYDIPGYLKQDDLIITADAVQKLQQIQAMLDAKQGTGKSLSLVNFTELAKTVNQGRPLTEYELTAIYRTLDHDFRDALLGSFFAADDGQARISLRISDTTDGLNRAEFMTDLKQSMADLGIEKDQYQLTSLFVLYQDILQRLFRSQILTIGLVFIVLSLTFWVIFRSLKIALIAIIPNIVTTIIILGVMGLGRIPLDLMTITIAAIGMGIAVDDTIHYLHRFLAEHRQHSTEKAIEKTHASVGHAILYTSLVIILGFSALSFSDFVPSVLFGLLTALSIAVALLCDLCLLPVLLKRFMRNRNEI
ncbi:efflux RND transporter permease subunit [Synoicihabitans lomoniglobus]|uniref:MMPL family transporter n=1 Tax=Synoicihabitans lomoniglobus TaxID=2909285 RepID=A0AAF0CMN7_9BACT|nr:MMPL family transporter [Opitutaceae bacterium LMO-M01]WED64413.1 MMPL family transporter [Opitutaceae bacterium LMO-M01]